MHSLVADHYQYIPIVGVIGLACAALRAVARLGPHARTWAVAAGIVAIACLFPATVSRASVLSSEERLWNDTLAKNPQSWAAHYNLATGLTLRARGLAESIVRQSAEIDGLAAQAQAMQARGDVAGASSARDAAAARQREVEATMTEFRRLGGDAVAHFRLSLELQPLYTRTYSNLGLMLGSLGQDEEAIATYRRGIEVTGRYYHREDSGLVFNLSQALIRQRRFAEAIPLAQDAVRLLPGDQEAQATLAAALAGLGGESRR
jgi:protein O-mannosyl-transferase